MIPARGFSSAEFFHCIETVLSYQLKKISKKRPVKIRQLQQLGQFFRQVQQLQQLQQLTFSTLLEKKRQIWKFCYTVYKWKFGKFIDMECCGNFHTWSWIPFWETLFLFKICWMQKFVESMSDQILWKKNGFRCVKILNCFKTHDFFK